MAGPYLRYRNQQRLIVSKGPSCRSWVICLSVSSLGLLAAKYTTESAVLVYIYVLGGLFLGVTFLGGWEDFILDRRRNLASLEWSSWYDCLNWQPKLENVKQLPLSSITAVQVASGRLQLVLNSGDLVPVMSEEGSIRQLRDLADQITAFLCLNHVEDIDRDHIYGYVLLQEEWTDPGEESSDSEMNHAVPLLSLPRVRDVLQVISEPLSPLE